MDKWRDYFWYLLPSPLKLVAKKVNQWYIFFKVIGDEFDKVQAELERAADETTIATCSDIMLPFFAEDRGLYRYPGEENDSFRSRIAMFDALEELGGTKEGIILAAASVGYDNVKHIWIPDLNGNEERWASFILQTYENLGDDIQLDFQILMREVRDKKESVSQDMYEKIFTVDSGTAIRSGMAYEAELWAVFWQSTRRLTGGKLLDGSKKLSGPAGNLELLPFYLPELRSLTDMRAGMGTENLLEYKSTVTPETGYATELWAVFWQSTRRLTGGKLLDGSKKLSGPAGNLELLPFYLMELRSLAESYQELDAPEIVYDVLNDQDIEGTVDIDSSLCFYNCRRLDGSRLLGGSRYLDATPGLASTTFDTAYNIENGQFIEAFCGTTEL